jgi:hypothetical protein
MVTVLVEFIKKAPWPPAGGVPVFAMVSGKVLLLEPRLLKVMERE